MNLYYFLQILPSSLSWLDIQNVANPRSLCSIFSAEDGSRTMFIHLLCIWCRADICVGFIEYFVWFIRSKCHLKNLSNLLQGDIII